MLEGYGRTENLILPLLLYLFFRVVFLGLTGFLREKLFIVKFYCIMCLLQSNLVYYSLGYEEMENELHKWFKGVPHYFSGS